jgi:hypothetical protein
LIRRNNLYILLDLEWSVFGALVRNAIRPHNVLTILYDALQIKNFFNLQKLQSWVASSGPQMDNVKAVFSSDSVGQDCFIKNHKFYADFQKVHLPYLPNSPYKVYRQKKQLKQTVSKSMS